MTSKKIIGSTAFLAFAFITFGNTNTSAQVFDLSWFSIDNGGGYTAGGNLELNGTIGQHDAGATMIGGNFELTGGFWTAALVSMPDIIRPTSFAVILGTLDSGTVQEMIDSDDQYVVMDPTFSAFRYQLICDINARSQTLTPSVLEFTLESKTFNIVGLINQRIQLFNFNSGQFETVDLRPTNSFFFDVVTTVTPTGDPSRFIQQGSGQMRARIYYENGFAYWVFVIATFFLPFETSVDQVFWTITP